MRKINSILSVIALCAIALSSCKKDEAASTPAYIGTWLETNFIASGCTDPGDDEVHACTAPDCESLIISATTITIVKPGSANEVYPYTASGNTLTVTVGGTTGTITVTVVVSGTIMTVTLQNSAANGGCLNVTTYTKS